MVDNNYFNTKVAFFRVVQNFVAQVIIQCLHMYSSNAALMHILRHLCLSGRTAHSYTYTYVHIHIRVCRIQLCTHTHTHTYVLTESFKAPGIKLRWLNLPCLNGIKSYTFIHTHCYSCIHTCITAVDSHTYTYIHRTPAHTLLHHRT
jgi:hypothetical protein